MFKGTVTFCATIKGNGLTFPLVEFNPHEPGIDKVEIEADQLEVGDWQHGASCCCSIM